MTRSRSGWMVWVLVGLILSGCQTMAPRPDSSSTITSGYRPASDTDEAGLWLVMDREEQALKTSGRVVNDVAINAYLRRILCRLEQSLCSDIRLYLVRIPYFNATMAPNGVMQVWTGLLLRTTNEAQLASVLAHEIAHYSYQHSLERFRQIKNTASFLAPFQLVTAAGGVGYAGSIAELIAIGSILKFSRDDEREADSGGLEMMIAAGYDPREAPKVWEWLLQEKAALDEDGPSIFLSTHPSPEERIDTLRENAAAVSELEKGWDIGADEYRQIIAPLKFELFRDELRLRRFAATQILLDRALAEGGSVPDIKYFQGELYSARRNDDDLAKAEAAFRDCIQYAEAPAEAYRELAMIYMKSGRGDQAVPLFETYLEREPEAFDRGMVDAYIRRINSGGSSK